MQKPLLDAGEAEKLASEPWEKGKLARKRELLGLLDFEHRNPKSQDIQIGDWTLAQLQPVLDSKDPDLMALALLLRRFPRARDAERFAASLCARIRAEVPRADEALCDFLRKLLVGAPEGGGGLVARCMTYFDVAELLDVSRPEVASAQTERALIACLHDRDRRAQGELGLSYLTGQEEPLIQDVFPKPAFPVIGPAPLYSNNSKAIPALTRYGLEGAQAFQVDVRQAQAICDALAFLTDPKRKGKTWTSFAGQKKKPLLLLAWLQSDPGSDAPLAKVLGGEVGETEYAVVCHQALELLKLEPDVKRDALVHLELFEGLDPGRKQICFSERWTLKELYDSVIDWLDAFSGSSPDVRLLGPWNRERQAPDEFRPFCPSPGAIYRLMRMQYRSQRGGPSKQPQETDSKRFSYRQAYRLVFPHQSEAIDDAFVQDCLRKALDAAGDLLTDAGGYQVALPSQPFDKGALQNACTALSLLGILLYKLHIGKEQQMNNPAFALGRLLKLADLLHRNYCVYERNSGDKSKSLPRVMMGNAVFPLARKRPLEAVQRLEEKIPLYLAWAQNDLESHSIWIVRAMGLTTAFFDEPGHELPETFTAAQEAMLLFGYLAELPEEYKPQKSERSAAPAASAEEPTQEEEYA